MLYLKFAGLSIAAAFALGLATGAQSAPLSNSRSALEVSGMVDGLIIEAQTPGMVRRSERRMHRVDRRMDRRNYRTERRVHRRSGH